MDSRMQKGKPRWYETEAGRLYHRQRTIEGIKRSNETGWEKLCENLREIEKLGVDPIQVLKFDVMVLPGNLTKNQHYRAFDLFREKKTAEDVYMAIFGKPPVTDEAIT